MHEILAISQEEADEKGSVPSASSEQQGVCHWCDKQSSQMGFEKSHCRRNDKSLRHMENASMANEDGGEARVPLFLGVQNAFWRIQRSAKVVLILGYKKLCLGTKKFWGDTKNLGIRGEEGDTETFFGIQKKFGGDKKFLLDQNPRTSHKLQKIRNNKNK